MIVSNCGGRRRIRVKKHRRASDMRRRRSALRWRSTARGSANGTGRRAFSICIVRELGFVGGLVMLTSSTLLVAQTDEVRLALDKLVVAYPDILTGDDAEVLNCREG